jgi:hypothetical protein
VIGAVVFAPFALAIVVIGQPQLTWITLVFVLVAVCLRTLYAGTLTAGYHGGDLSLVYPIARASGPLLAMVGAIALFGEHPTVVAIGGALANRGRERSFSPGIPARCAPVARAPRSSTTGRSASVRRSSSPRWS